MTVAQQPSQPHQTSSPSENVSQKLALEGGPKAFANPSGKSQPKIGVEEFMSVAKRFGFKPEALARIESAVSNEDFEGDGPNFARYFCLYPERVAGSQMERLACQKFGVKHALTTSSGTGALHAAFVAVGVGPGTEVICPAVGFMATSAAVVMAGGVPVFCDVDESLQIDPNKILSSLTPRTVAIAPTHHWGGVADMDPILEIARKNKLKVVEDCAQSPGGRYHGKYVGTMGDIGVFSISAYKIIGGGEGGMLICNDDRLFERAQQLAECGGLWRADRFAPPRYDGELFCGTNYRMSELEASIDLVQLGKLDEVVYRYRSVRNRILRQLKRFKEIVPQKLNDPEGEVGYLVRFFPESHELSSKIANALVAEGIAAGTRGTGAGPDWHLASDMFPVIQKHGVTQGGTPFEDPRYLSRGGKVNYTKDSWPVATDLYNRCVGFFISQWYDVADCDAIARGVNKVLNAYCTEDAGARGWM